MVQRDDSQIRAIVNRFLEERRNGERVSVDDLMASFEGQPDAAEIRTAALRMISHASDMGMGEISGESTTDDLQADFPNIEGYDVIDFVGQGGMGTVYEAHQRATGRRVALKVLKEAISSSDSAKRRFEREVELVARLEHPAISAIVDSGVHRGHYFYVMEYIEGRSLGEAFSEQQHNVRDILRVMIDICNAVEYAHQRRVLHRDLKPSNIMVDAQGRPHILDFGLAKLIDDTATGSSGQTLSAPGQILGTLAYMSPEQSRGEVEQIGLPSDVYSLGAIAYELVTGELPCPMGGPVGDVLDRIAHKEPARPTSLLHRRASKLRYESSHPSLPKDFLSQTAWRSVDADLDAILLKALAKEPRLRYANAREMAEDIGRWLDGRGVHARRAGYPEQLWRWCRRNRWAATAGGLLFLLAVVATIAAVRDASYQTTLEVDQDAVRSVVRDADKRGGQKPRYILGEQPVREKLLSLARCHYEPYVQNLRSRPTTQQDLSYAHLGLGILFLETGRLSEAAIRFKQTQEIVERLIEQNPAEARFQSALAYCYESLGQIHRKRKQVEAALKSYDSALEIQETLVEEYPEVNEYKRKLVEMYQTDVDK